MRKKRVKSVHKNYSYFVLIFVLLFVGGYFFFIQRSVTGHVIFEEQSFSESAFRDAMNVSGNRIKLAPGTYLVDPRVSILPADNVTLEGSGWDTIIKVKDGVGDFLCVFGGNPTTSKPIVGLTLKNFTLDLNPKGYGGHPNNTNLSAGVLSWQNQNITIDNLNITYGGVVGIDFNAGALESRNAVVKNCRFTYILPTGSNPFDTAGVYIEGYNHTIVNNTFISIYDNHVGSAIETHAGPSVVKGNNISGYNVGINVVSANWRNGEIDPNSPSGNMLIENNNIVDVMYGVLFWAQYSPGRVNQTLRNVTVNQNYINPSKRWNNTYWAAGIAINWGGNSTNGAYENIKSTNNIIVFDKNDTRTGKSILYWQLHSGAVMCVGATAYNTGGKITNCTQKNNTVINLQSGLFSNNCTGWLDENLVCSPCGEGVCDYGSNETIIKTIGGFSVSPGAVVNFNISSDSLNLSSMGVPYRDALIRINYVDSVNDNVYSTSGTLCDALGTSANLYTTNCLPILETKLDFSSISYWSLTSIGGWNDSNSKEKLFFFESSPFQMLRSINGSFQFRIVFPANNYYNNSLVINSISLEFINKTEFNRLRELERKGRGLNRTDYVETNTINSSEYSKDYVLYSRNYLNKVYPNTIPPKQDILNDGSELSTFEVDGNYEPLTFGIYAFSDLKNLTISVTDLTNGLNKILSTNVSVQKIVFTDKRWEYSWVKNYGTNPWYLSDFSSLDVQKNTSEWIWLNIYVPKGTPAGIYSGNVNVQVPGKSSSSVRIKMGVYDIDLSEPDSTPYLYHSPYYHHYSDPKDVAAADMIRHDINPVLYTSLSINLVNDSINFVNLDKELDSYITLGGKLPEKVMIGGAGLDTDSLWTSACGSASYCNSSCPAFDTRMTNILIAYKQHIVSKYGVEPSLSYRDEPGNNPYGRLNSNCMNRPTKAAGIETWVTYYPPCEDILSGWDLKFVPNFRYNTSLEQYPSFLKNDSALVSYWNFENQGIDKSNNKYNLQLYPLVGSGCNFTNSQLVCNGSGTSLNNSFKLPAKNFTFMLGFKINLDAMTSGAWKYIIQTDGWYLYQHPANNYIYFYGGQGSQLMYWVPQNNLWHFLLCTHETEGKSYCYVDGAYTPFYQQVGNLGASSNIQVGGFDGSVDEVLILNRTLSVSEIGDVLTNFLSDYGTRSKLVLSTTISQNEIVPSSIKFSTQTFLPDIASLYGALSIKVNNITVWQINLSKTKTSSYDVDLSSYIPTNHGNVNVSFTIEDYTSIPQETKLFLQDSFWRNRSWTANANSSYWNYSYTEDLNGVLGPMDPYLDNRVYAMYYVSENEISKTLDSGDYFSYYTTYPANQPAMLNNRFLNGVYASALGAYNVVVYAYGDSNTDNYDDLEIGTRERPTNSLSAVSYGNYQLAMPSWNQKMYDTIVYESLREGIEDSKIIATLKKSISEHPGAKADEAQNYLNGIFSRLDKSYNSRYRVSNYSAAIEDRYDGGSIMLTDLSGNSEDYSFFDGMRENMLNYIQEIESPAAVCGDKVCESLSGETCSTCSQDCGECINLRCSIESGKNQIFNVKDFGAVGDGVHDDTASIQNAINNASSAKNGTVLIPNGTYMINAVAGINLKNNTRMILEKNAILRAIPNEAWVYQVININRVENCSVAGGVIEGERYSHQTNTGEFGMGIQITASKGIIISNMTIRNNWGDGIQIGLDYAPPSSNIIIDNITCDNNRRNGISVIEGQNILIKDSVMEYSNGVRPNSGIDIEPDFASQIIKNIILRDITTIDNVKGISIYINKNLDPYFITVENHTNINTSYINPNYIFPYDIVSPGGGVILRDGVTIKINCTDNCLPQPDCNINFVCELGETFDNCPFDCGVCPSTVYCGDGVCVNEDCNSCSQDCGTCNPKPIVTTTSGGSGGENISENNTIIINEKELSLGLYKEFEVGTTGIFDTDFSENVNQHSLSLTSVDETSIGIVIRSDAQFASVNVGEARKFELDNDGYYDVKVSLKSIENNRAYIGVRKIAEDVLTGAGPIGPADGDPINPSDEVPGTRSNFIFYVVFIVLVLVVISLLVVVYLMRRNRVEQTI